MAMEICQVFSLECNKNQSVKIDPYNTRDLAETKFFLLLPLWSFLLFPRPLAKL